MIAVGPGRRSKDGEVVAPSVKEGDRVLLPEYGGNMVKLGGSDNKEWVFCGHWCMAAHGCGHHALITSRHPGMQRTDTDTQHVHARADPCSHQTHS